MPLAADRLWYNVGVPYPKVGLGNAGSVRLGAVPLVRYYSVFSSWPGLGCGTLIQCVLLLNNAVILTFVLAMTLLIGIYSGQK